MGRLTEDYGKQLLKKEGIKIPPGSVACSPGEASKAAGMLNFPVYVKALVPVGKRGKAGAVKKAANAGEVYKAAEEIMNNKYYNYPVKRVLVEEALEITRELFASITFDFVKRSPVAICGSSGGVDVEEIRRQSPEKIKITEIDPVFGLNPFQAVGIWKQVGLQGRELVQAAGVLVALYRVFRKYDAKLVEVNPLGVTADGDVKAAAAVINVDDQALFRHPEFDGILEVGQDRVWKDFTELEKRVLEANSSIPGGCVIRYTELDGDIGFAVFGGGASLTVMDTIIKLGGKPANYADISPGSGAPQKVAVLFKTILSKPGLKGLIVGGNIVSASSSVAKGSLTTIALFKELNLDLEKFPVVLRVAGNGWEEAMENYRSLPAIHVFGPDTDLQELAGEIVRLTNGHRENKA